MVRFTLSKRQWKLITRWLGRHQRPFATVRGDRLFVADPGAHGVLVVRGHLEDGDGITGPFGADGFPEALLSIDANVSLVVRPLEDERGRRVLEWDVNGLVARSEHSTPDFEGAMHTAVTKPLPSGHGFGMGPLVAADVAKAFLGKGDILRSYVSPNGAVVWWGPSWAYLRLPVQFEDGDEVARHALEAVGLQVEQEEVV